MKITFRQSGSVVGGIRGCELETGELPAKEKARLEALVEKSGIHGSVTKHTRQARDATQYDITIEKGGQKHQVSVDDLTLPAEVQPLLEYLQRHARPQPLR